jgi:ATPase subunit of ABC transporter with duplicated ATPase domains
LVSASKAVLYAAAGTVCLTGTGKTTFLKALASHTKRSIINIPLSRIRTNQQLMSLMMDQQVRVRQQGQAAYPDACHQLQP